MDLAKEERLVAKSNVFATGSCDTAKQRVEASFV